jgi:HEAT repeat protein
MYGVSIERSGAARHVLQDEAENAMVRHEAAEALGAIADPHCVQLLEDYKADADPIVAHSCEVRPRGHYCNEDPIDGCQTGT